MHLTDRDALLIVGHAARTTNTAESDPHQAMIPALWAKARTPGAFDHVPGRTDNRLYAVLTDYDTDHTGPYTQIVGVAVSSLQDLPEGLVAVRVPAAHCLTQQARGPMPQALIEAWHNIWKHTESGGDPARTFTTDLEIHHNKGADIYLAIR